MRKRQLAGMILLTAALTGCSGAGPDAGNTEDQRAQEGEASGDENAPDTESATGEKDAEGNAADTEDISGEADTESLLPEAFCQGGMLQEDADALYFCSPKQIWRIEKADGRTQALWDADAQDEDSLLYREGKALILGEYLYFLEDWSSENEYGRCLSQVRKDGTGYERIGELEDFPDVLCYSDGKLYLESGGSAVSYALAPDGSIAKKEPEEVSFVNLSGSCYLVNARHGGSWYLSMTEALDTFGCYLFENQDMELVAVSPRTGEERKLPAAGRLRSFNEEYLLFVDYVDNGQEVSLMDTQLLREMFEEEARDPDDASVVTEAEDIGLAQTESVQAQLLVRYETSVTVLDMDKDYVYVVVENPQGEPQENSIYERISLESGEREELFRLGRRLGMEGSYPYYDQSVNIRSGYIYYADASDYKIYLMRRSLVAPEKVEILGDAFYDSGISQVGYVEGYFERIYSQARPDFVLTGIDLERLVVGDRYAGAEEINRVLTEYQEEIIQYEKSEEKLAWQEKEVASVPAEEEIPYSLNFSYSSYPSPVSYFDGRIFSFRQMDYEYTGGAHGMPYWEGFTFDLESGERLLLSDLIGNSEQELKEIVVRYFGEYMAGLEENFWEDALTTVRDGTDYSSPFYLTREGICFYFGPYELASYAAGFQQVTIPFSEFETKADTLQAY